MIEPKKPDVRELLERLDAAYSNATKGPWIPDPNDPAGITGTRYIQFGDGQTGNRMINGNADVQLVCLLHSSYPALRRHIEQMEAELAALRADAERNAMLTVYEPCKKHAGLPFTIQGRAAHLVHPPFKICPHCDATIAQEQK